MPSDVAPRPAAARRTRRMTAMCVDARALGLGVESDGSSLGLGLGDTRGMVGRPQA